MKKFILLGAFILLSFQLGCRQGVEKVPGPSCQDPSDPGCQNSTAELKAPTDVNAIAISPSKITVTWQPVNFKDTYSIELEMKENGQASFTHLDTLADDDMLFEAKDLKANTKYEFRLRAVSSSKTTDYTSVVSATTFQSTNPIPMLVATQHPTTTGAIQLTVTYSNTNLNLISYVTYIRDNNFESLILPCETQTTCPLSSYDVTPPAGPSKYQIIVHYTDSTTFASALTPSITPTTVNPSAKPIATLTAAQHPTTTGVIQLSVSYSNTNLNLISYVTYIRDNNFESLILPCETQTTCPLSSYDVTPPAGPSKYQIIVHYTDSTTAASPLTPFISPTVSTSTTLPTPTNFSAIVSFALQNFQTAWTYGASTTGHSGFEIQWTLPYLGTSGTKQINSTSARNLTFLAPTGCTDSENITFKIRAKSNSATVNPSAWSPTITRSCPELAP